MYDKGKKQDATPAAESETADLRTKSLELLDFPAIRERVATHTTLPLARDFALQLTPSHIAEDVDVLQRETAEGLVFLDEVGNLGLHTAEDVSSAIDRAALDGSLSGHELLAVAASLEAQRRARSALLGVRGSVPLLADIAEGIPDLGDIQQRIGACIGDRGEVLDQATPTLGKLRHHVRTAYKRVTEALERIFHSSAGQEALQDQVVSMRGERLVLQVKTELRHRIPGVVLDASNTGATLFTEPFATVDLCNAWTELVLEEAREVSKVLRDLSLLVGASADDIRRGTQLAAQLDFIMARSGYSQTLKGTAVPSRAGAVRRSQKDQPAGVRLIGARHPLLGQDAVPININIGPGWSALLITGPNTGGKTAAMKTVGMLALMHQSGLYIPADEGSSLPVFDGIYADVGDQQSIEQSVSTFGSHIRNVIDILSSATTASLVLLDELGTSTDPEEGSALAKAILGHLAARGVTTIATTHHRGVAAHAEATTGMMNASVELDPASLRPTYHLTLGVPGRSYAMSVAAEMGVPDEIMEEASSLLEPQHLRFEDWLNELQSQRLQLQDRLREADETQARAEAAQRDLDAQLDELESHREDILRSTRGDLATQYEEVRSKLRRAEAELSWRPSADEVEEARVEITSAKRELQALDRRVPRKQHRLQEGPLAIGDLVDIQGLNVQGRIESISKQDSEAEVAVGDVRFRLDIHRLARAQEEQEEKEREPDDPKVSYRLASAVPTMELNLHGSRPEDAMIKVDEFLDKALIDGLSTVHIIHGRGTGALRRAIRDLLACHPLAKSFAPAAPENGGDGATVVELT